MKIIQFGSENGCSKAGNTIRPYQIRLNEIFFNDDKEPGQFRTLDGLSIVFRVSGKNKDFKGEGPEFLQKSKGRNFITIDLTIPQNRWLGIDKVEFGKYLSNGIKECFNLLKNFAGEMDELCDKDQLDEHFQKGMKLFEEFYRS